MKRRPALLEAAFFGLLGLWLGALVMSGAAAAVIFPTMRDDVRPRMADYDAYSGDHWRLAGGIVAERVFEISDLVQGISAALLLGVGAALFAGRLKRRAGRGLEALRIILIIAAVATIAYERGSLRPRMNASLSAYRAAAQTGDNTAAAMHQAAFEELHPLASGLMVTRLLLLVGAGGVAAWSLLAPRPERACA